MSSSPATSPNQKRNKNRSYRLSTASTSQTSISDLDDDEHDIRSPRYTKATSSTGSLTTSRSHMGNGGKFTPFTVKGFLVSISKALTYEIDLSLSAEQATLLAGAHTSVYRYHNYPADHLRNPELTPLTQLPATQGTCYRCRLKGVNFVDHDTPIWKINRMTIFAKQLTDRGNGWVSCTIYSIDQYHRLITDISIVTTEGELSVKDQLVEYTSNNEEHAGLLRT